MGERNRRLIYWIVRGTMHPARMQRKFGMTAKELQTFIERNQAEIVFKKLKGNFSDSMPAKRRASKNVPNRATVSVDSEGTHIFIK